MVLLPIKPSASKEYYQREYWEKRRCVKSLSRELRVSQVKIKQDILQHGLQFRDRYKKWLQDETRGEDEVFVVRNSRSCYHLKHSCAAGSNRKRITTMKRYIAVDCKKMRPCTNCVKEST